MADLVWRCLLILTWWAFHICQDGECHKWQIKPAKALEFSKAPGVMMSFENPIYSNGYFLGFDAWDNINKRYGMTNITYIVRIEFKRQGFKENKIKRHFKRFWLPGANWVERNIRSNHIYRSNITEIKVRNQSHVDLWVYPKCFLRHHGISRIHRVAKTMRITVKHIRWLAKVNYGEDEGYGPRELIEIATGMTQVQGIFCAWLHPRIEST